MKDSADILAVLEAHRGSATEFCRACDWVPSEWQMLSRFDDNTLTRMHQSEVLAERLGLS